MEIGYSEDLSISCSLESEGEGTVDTFCEQKMAEKAEESERDIEVTEN